MKKIIMLGIFLVAACTTQSKFTVTAQGRTYDWAQAVDSSEMHNSLVTDWSGE